MGQTVADFIGAHATGTILVLVLLVLLSVSLLWRLLQANYKKLWDLGSALWVHITKLTLMKRLRELHPPLWSFLGNRLSAESYLGIHLTLGLLLMLGAVHIFGAIAESVGEQEALYRFDQQLAAALHNHTSPAEVAVFKVVTALGDTPVLVSLGVVVTVFLLIRRRWWLLGSWIVGTLGAGPLNFVLKSIFQRPRPELASPVATAPFWSFPSGHAMSSMITYGLLAYLLILFVGRRLAAAGIALLVSLVLVIGFSRMYLGVHYFSDVVAGYTAGASWLAIVISGTEVTRRRKQQQRMSVKRPE